MLFGVRGPEKVLPRAQHQKWGLLRLVCNIQYQISYKNVELQHTHSHTHSYLWNLMSHVASPNHDADTRYHVCFLFLLCEAATAAAQCILKPLHARGVYLFSPCCESSFLPSDHTKRTSTLCVSIYTRQATGLAAGMVWCTDLFATLFSLSVRAEHVENVKWLVYFYYLFMDEKTSVHIQFCVNESRNEIKWANSFMALYVGGTCGGADANDPVIHTHPLDTRVRRCKCLGINFNGMPAGASPWIWFDRLWRLSFLQCVYHLSGLTPAHSDFIIM